FRRTQRVLTTAARTSAPSTRLLRVHHPLGCVVHAGRLRAMCVCLSSETPGFIHTPPASAASPRRTAARPAPPAPGQPPPARPSVGHILACLPPPGGPGSPPPAS